MESSCWGFLWTLHAAIVRADPMTTNCQHFLWKETGEILPFFSRKLTGSSHGYQTNVRDMSGVKGGCSKRFSTETSISLLRSPMAGKLFPHQTLLSCALLIHLDLIRKPLRFLTFKIYTLVEIVFGSIFLERRWTCTYLGVSTETEIASWFVSNYIYIYSFFCESK